MSTPENEPQNPQTPPAVPSPPQYGQVAPEGQNPQPGAPQQNPYGQNPYGQQPAQNPYGQNPNPYGQPPQAPTPYGQQPYGAGFQVPPQGNFPAPQMPSERPKDLNIAFWAIIAAGVANLLGYVFLALMMSEAVLRQSMDLVFEMMPELEGQLDLESLDLSTLVTQSRISYIVFGLIGTAIYVLVAFMVRKGSKVARVFATVFAALSVLLLIGSSPLGIVAIVLGIVGVVFAWRRPASNYIAARSAARAAGFR